MKSEKIIILGLTGSGKNKIAHDLFKKGLVMPKKITTNPYFDKFKYNIVSNSYFDALIDTNKLATYCSYTQNNFIFYEGITKENLKKGQVFILSTKEYNQLDKKKNKLFIVLFNIDRNIREKRLYLEYMSCENKEKTINYLNNEEKIFKKTNIDYDLMINSSDIDYNDIYSLMD